MTSNLDLWKLLAGLGIFLFGMHQLEDAIKSRSGKVSAPGSPPFSSPARLVSLMVLAFVGAGVVLAGPPKK